MTDVIKAVNSVLTSVKGPAKHRRYKDSDVINADVASIAGSQSSTAPRRRSRPDHRRKEQSQEIQSIADAAKLSVSSIIDSVITESHEERLLARGDGKGPLEDGTDPSMITDGAGGLLSPCRSESTVDSEIANDYAYMAALVDPTTTDTDPP
uniref:Uncharacterized protein n=1 Tax=Plectus sambesii TaxID=2011161 RepID=A0A914VAB8_9BILA